MKFPCNPRVLIEAWAYARESLAHTFNYQGWRDGHRKAQRIATGKFAQLWLAEFCRLNNIPCAPDRSSPYVADAGDLTINGWVIDCKVSVVHGLEGQISPRHERESNVDYYAFFRSDKELSFIEPLGFVRFSDVKARAVVVSKGEKIPGTSVVQRFDRSYFIPLRGMDRFSTTIDVLRRTRKEAAA